MFILCNTSLSRSSIKWTMGVLVGSFLNFSATANIPSLLGILVYSDDTSKVHKMAPSGIGPSSLIFLIKSWVSLMYDLVLGT